ncbi:MAG TPA: aldo/keto reductase [Longimicrobiaceae bacterium]|nr:aldo/keto reductase [Longimicrobiaceae bacterium]
MAEPGAARGMERVVLGTVQLGLPYGARAGAGTMPEHAARAVLDAAWALGIRAFDTAEAYGESAARLERWLRGRGVAGEAHVVTKVKPGEGPGIGGRVERALARFPDAASRTLLTHGGAGGREWEEAAAAARACDAAAGQSVYGRDGVEAAVACAGVERVQAPGNLFDLGALAGRAGAPVALDLRSVYLQGLLASPPAAAEARVPGAGALAGAVAAAAAGVGEEPAALLCAVVLGACRRGDRLVVGVDAPEQLAPVARAVSLDPPTVQAFARAAREAVAGPVDPRVLDPRRW